MLNALRLAVSPMSITIFLADDHGIVREGLRLLLETQPDFTIVGEAATGCEALQRITQCCPNVAILDILMPEFSGIEVTRQLHLACPTTLVIILSVRADPYSIIQALRAGARGYLDKTSASSEVVEAIRAVHSGQRYLSQKIMHTAMTTCLSQAKAVEDQDPLAQLSPREREILFLLLAGNSSSEIGQLLFLSPHTVDTYRSRLMHKLGVHDLFTLVRFAIRYGVIPLE